VQYEVHTISTVVFQLQGHCTFTFIWVLNWRTKSIGKLTLDIMLTLTVQLKRYYFSQL